jgi:hypothetical protein
MNCGRGNLPNTGEKDIFVAKLDNNGKHLWSYSFGSSGYDEGHGIALDANNNVYVTGFISGAIQFGEKTITTNGARDIFLFKFDTGGKHLWAKTFGSSKNDLGRGIAIDKNNMIYLTGSFVEKINFGGKDLLTTAEKSIYVAKFDINGSHYWSYNYQGNGEGYSIKIDNNSDTYYLSGFFSGILDAGDQVHYAKEDVINAFLTRCAFERTQ